MDLNQVRLRLEEAEGRLSPHAARTSTSRGRKRPEVPSPVRTEYQRDRDRILHTKAFRRLKHKTQVFIAPALDHYVTRLTHTLEVAQVARTIARALNLNEDLAEAAALGHDIGHGPFGHAGEEALAECLPEGFRHNYQSVRVLDKLEHNGEGLNLTFEVLDAIEKSSKAREDIFAEGWGVPVTLEGQVVKTADAIAYVNHDILDADPRRPDHGGRPPGRVAAGVGWHPFGPAQHDDLRHHRGKLGGYRRRRRHPSSSSARGCHSAANELREFMFSHVYLYDSTRREAERGKQVVKFLFEHYAAHPGEHLRGLLVAG